MKMLATILAFFVLSVFPINSTENSNQQNNDKFRLTLSLNVPRVYNNTYSLGYRKYQKQQLSGNLSIIWKSGQPTICVDDIVNLTHKISGKAISYDCEVTYSHLNAIGDNKSEKFTKATVSFDIEAEPSYALQDLNEDNGLYLKLSGSGSIAKRNGRYVLNSASGYAVGQIGCGCSDYGHISPTRILSFNGPNLLAIDDIAAVYGTWRLRRINSK